MTSTEISNRIKSSRKYIDVRESLISQLRATGADTPTFLSLIDDYMNFWVIKEQTKIDIAVHGVYIEYNNGGGQSGVKENPSVAYQLKLSSQMLKILQQLKLDVESAGGAADDEL